MMSADLSGIVSSNKFVKQELDDDEMDSLLKMIATEDAEAAETTAPVPEAAVLEPVGNVPVAEMPAAEPDSAMSIKDILGTIIPPEPLTSSSKPRVRCFGLCDVSDMRDDEFEGCILSTTRCASFAAVGVDPLDVTKNTKGRSILRDWGRRVDGMLAVKADDGKVYLCPAHLKKLRTEMQRWDLGKLALTGVGLASLATAGWFGASYAAAAGWLGVRKHIESTGGVDGDVFREYMNDPAKVEEFLEDESYADAAREIIKQRASDDVNVLEKEIHDIRESQPRKSKVLTEKLVSRLETQMPPLTLTLTDLGYEPKDRMNAMEQGLDMLSRLGNDEVTGKTKQSILKNYEHELRRNAVSIDDPERMRRLGVSQKLIDNLNNPEFVMSDNNYQSRGGSETIRVKKGKHTAYVRGNADRIQKFSEDKDIANKLLTSDKTTHVEVVTRPELKTFGAGFHYDEAPIRDVMESMIVRNLQTNELDDATVNPSYIQSVAQEIDALSSTHPALSKVYAKHIMNTVLPKYDGDLLDAETTKILLNNLGEGVQKHHLLTRGNIESLNEMGNLTESESRTVNGSWFRRFAKKWTNPEKSEGANTFSLFMKLYKDWVMAENYNDGSFSPTT